VHTLFRILGIQAASRLAARLPGPYAIVATGLVLVVSNLLPVLAVVTEQVGMGDVFLVYWFENVVVWACGIVRTATAQGDGTRTVPGKVNGRPTDLSMAKFFALHYGIFTLVHGIFTVIVVAIVGLEGGVLQVALLALVITASHLFSLGVNWFGRNERAVVSPGRAMVAPYPRMFVLHVGIIIAFGVALDGWENGENVNDQIATVAVLCVMKTVVDLGFHVWQHWRRQAVRQGDGLYGTLAQEQAAQE
jgi:hypothetical protein